MSYSPIGAPDEILPLALELATKANTIRTQFEERVDDGEDIPLGDQIEMLRPLWELTAQLDAILKPARDRAEFWADRA